MKKKVLSIVLLCLYLCVFKTVAQVESKTHENFPEVGKQCPDFTFTQIDHYSKKQVSLSDFKGKWLILDFWTTGCTACIKSFPKVNELQQNFRNDIQFVLVAKHDEKYNKNIQVMYEKFRVKQNLELAIAYDTILFKQFGVQTVPHVIVIDKNSIVRAVTYGSEINDVTLKAFIDGKELLLEKKYNEYESIPQQTVDLRKPLLVDGNGGKDADFLYRSLLMKWNISILSNIREGIDNEVDNGYFQGTAISLSWLYNYAYVGKNIWIIGDPLYDNFWRFPILELKDTTLFLPDLNSGQGLYNYSLIVPQEKASKKYFMKIIQNDLDSYFGYDVTIENRMMPCWKLIVTSNKVKDKLKTNGAPRSIKGDHAGYEMVNVPIINLLSSFWALNQSEPPFIDKTGIVGNIDITIDAILSDLNDIKKALQKNGLDLVKGEKEMKVIVIRDPKNTEALNKN